MISQGISKKRNIFTTEQWAALIIGFVLMLLSGLVNGWSIFVEPIEQDLNLRRQETSLVFTISLSVSIGGQMLSGLLARWLKPRYIYWIAALFSATGFWGTSFVKSIGGIYFFYGVFAGLAIGMIYNLVLTGVIALFDTNTSLISGILLMGFGVGPLVLGVGASFLLKLLGWRSTFAILAILYAVLLVAAPFLMAPSSKKKAREKYNVSAGISTLNMLKSRSYQYFFWWCVMIGSATLILVGHSSLISRDIGAGFNTASLMTGIISVSSGVSRIISGYIADRWGSNKLKSVLNFCCVVGGVVVIVSYFFAWLPALGLGYVLMGAANGGNAVYICDFVKENYGDMHYGMNMAVTNVYMILGSTLGTALAGIIKTQNGSYLNAFFVMLVYTVISVIFSGLLDKEKKLDQVKLTGQG